MRRARAGLVFRASRLLCLAACAACLLYGQAGSAAARQAAAGQDLDDDAAVPAHALPARLAQAAAGQPLLHGRRLHANATAAQQQQPKQPKQQPKQPKQEAQAQQARNTTAAKPAKRAAVVQWKGRRRPCAPDDAKCIALRDHDCDPYYQTVQDK